MRSGFTAAVCVSLYLSTLSCAASAAPNPRPAPPQAPATPTPTPSAQHAPATSPAPRVRLLATGGTISNRTGGRLTGEELIKAIPDLPRYATPEFEQFANTSSSAL